MTNIQQLPAWLRLQTLRNTYGELHLRDYFRASPRRGQIFSAEAAGLTLDYSRNFINTDILDGLVALAKELDVPSKIQALIHGAWKNDSENRFVLHPLLRCKSFSPLFEAYPHWIEIQKQQTRWKAFARLVRQGEWRGFHGHPITNIVNLGIGGSDLGPRLLTEGLSFGLETDLMGHYLQMPDLRSWRATMNGLDPKSTLFVVVSKSFTTEETLINAARAQAWLKEYFQNDSALSQHMVAVTAAPALAQKFGFSAENVFEMPLALGGRYSTWSAVGLSSALVLGEDVFEGVLAGAAAMDEHLATAPLQSNLPVIQALLSVWYRNFWGAESFAALCYHPALRSFPQYWQQLGMESNGKQVSKMGDPLLHATAPVIWGGVGPETQHSFMQALHQGTVFVPIDFLVATSEEEEAAPFLYANCLAQAQVLMRGSVPEETPAKSLRAKHSILPGNRPSSIVSFRELTPEVLGALMALYEHRTFIESLIWGNNAFDQWGVEYGKYVAHEFLKNCAQSGMEAATEQLLLYPERSI